MNYVKRVIQNFFLILVVLGFFACGNVRNNENENENDNNNNPSGPPIFSTADYIVEVTNRIDFDTNIIRVSAFDPDGGVVTYQITSITDPTGAKVPHSLDGPVGSDPPFAIDTNGNIRRYNRLDRNTRNWHRFLGRGVGGAILKQGTYTFTVVATDDNDPPESAQVGVTVTIFNDNDGDGIRDALDPDDDNDGINDNDDPKPLATDCNLSLSRRTYRQEGTLLNRYCIDTLEELQSIATGFSNDYTRANNITLTPAQSLTKHYLLTADIDAWATNNIPAADRPAAITINGIDSAPAAYDGAVYSKGFAPIGNCFSGDPNSCNDAGDHPFTGSFLSYDRIIDGLQIRGDSRGHWGLFGTVLFRSGIPEAHFLSGVNLRNVSISGEGYVGAIAGMLIDQNQCSANSCHYSIGRSSISGTIKGSTRVDNIGGLVGYLNSANVVNSSTSAAVIGGGGDDNIGGLIGYQSLSGTFHVFAAGRVEGGDGKDNAGGLVGYNDRGFVAFTYTTSEVKGGGNDDNVGGLAGRNSGGMNEPGKINFNYTTGSVIGGTGDDNVGGLVGQNGNLNTQVEYNYRLSSASVTGETIEPTGTQKTDSQLKALTQTLSEDDFGSQKRWDGRYRWDFGDNTQYPALKSSFKDLICGQPQPRAQC